jgi:hypothetical protein
MFSCSRKTDLTPREEQEQQENAEPLLVNEILEQEGVKFTADYRPDIVKLTLRLYKGTGQNLTEIPLAAVQPNVNYSISVAELPENSDYTLTVEFTNVSENGTFSLTVVGYTDINASKTFVINGNAFTVNSNGTSKAYLQMRKGIHKFSFYKI